MAARTSLGLLVLGSALALGACTEGLLYVGSDWTASTGTGSTGTTTSTGTGGASGTTSSSGGSTGGAGTGGKGGAGTGGAGGTVACVIGPDGGAYVWSHGYGDTNEDTARSIAVDLAGSVVLAGAYVEAIDFGNGPLPDAGPFGSMAFVSRFDPTGAATWSKGFGSGPPAIVYGVATDAAGDVLTTGSFAGSIDFGGGSLPSAGGADAFVAKLDSNGTHIWSKQFGDAQDQEGDSVAVDASGAVFVAGKFYGSINFGGAGDALTAAGDDLFMAKLDANGHHVWSKDGGAGPVDPPGVAVDTLGNAVVAGDFSGSLDFGGGPSAKLTSTGADDVFVAKLDPGGGYVWAKQFGTDATGNSVAVDTMGNVFIAGGFSGSIDFGGTPFFSANVREVFVASFDGAGNHRWSQRFGGPASQETVYAVAVDSAGNAFVTGGFSGLLDFGGGPLVSAGQDDVFVASFDSAGNYRWSKRFGDSNEQRGRVIAADAFCHVLVAGTFHGTLDFGGGNPVMNGDVFLAQLMR